MHKGVVYYFGRIMGKERHDGTTNGCNAVVGISDPMRGMAGSRAVANICIETWQPKFFATLGLGYAKVQRPGAGGSSSCRARKNPEVDVLVANTLISVSHQDTGEGTAEHASEIFDCETLFADLMKRHMPKAKDKFELHNRCRSGVSWALEEGQRSAVHIGTMATMPVLLGNFPDYMHIVAATVEPTGRKPPIGVNLTAPR